MHALVFGLSIFFPLISVASFRAIGLIDSFEMEDKQQRIGPMIATIIFYVWLFMNYRSFDVGPKIFEPIILGSMIALSLAFLINNFSKISLHTVGMGGFIGAMAVCRVAEPRYSYDLPIGEGYLCMSPNYILAFVIVLAGMVGSSRLLLNAHRGEDIYGGYLVGFISQILAYKLLGI